ncbi:recombination system host exonuclease inhibitor [Lactiplantibacillus modestisalitolerans]|uniref:Recombination system host exonuclease inhibitor n=1 Tax=Lactiplantibacillus modestisalitolerans TaxID=1457219 RepID=A0ABV5WVD6_9LACO|nr:hypothetical protein [Lactiplantibacillus modestisalitolerans]
MDLVKQLDALNQAEDALKMAGPDEPEEIWYTYWTRGYAPQDEVEDEANFLEPESSYDKADLFDEYLSYNDSKQWLKDMQAEFNDYTCDYELMIDGTAILFQGAPNYEPMDKEDSPAWAEMVQTFGKACLWDELLKLVDQETLMERLGYYRV